VQLDVVGDRLVDEIAARTVLRGGQRIKRVDLCGLGAEADSFLDVAHNARTITCIIVYYKTFISSPQRRVALSSLILPMPMLPKLHRKRALFVLTKSDEILAWERQAAVRSRNWVTHDVEQ